MFSGNEEFVACDVTMEIISVEIIGAINLPIVRVSVASNLSSLFFRIHCWFILMLPCIMKMTIRYS